MSVVVIGVNQRSVPLSTFERLTVPEHGVTKVLDDVLSSNDVSEAVVLSTCNRTEIYANVERFHPAFGDIRDALARHGSLDPADFAEHLYAHHDEDAARHLFGVTCGLDSAVLGETEILGQVRKAYDVAAEADAVGVSLSDLFMASCTTGRKVRANTGIARNITSVSRAAVAMATDRLGSLEGRRIGVLGAGEMSEGMTVSLRDAGARDVVIANRTRARAEELAERVGGRVISLDDLPEMLASVDVLLTSTGASEVMVGEAALASAMTARPDRPLLIVDIAVPRDIAPEAADIDGVTLLDMEDLTRFAEVGKRERRAEIVTVRNVIDEEVARFKAASASRVVEPLVTSFRQEMETMRAAELDRLRGQLDDDTLANVDAATRRILNKLLHTPTTELRSAAGTIRGERLAASLSELFDLDAPGAPTDEV